MTPLSLITYGMLVSTIERIFSRFEAGMKSQINSLSTRIDLFNIRLQVIKEKAKVSHSVMSHTQSGPTLS